MSNPVVPITHTQGYNDADLKAAAEVAVQEFLPESYELQNEAVQIVDNLKKKDTVDATKNAIKETYHGIVHGWDDFKEAALALKKQGYQSVRFKVSPSTRLSSIFPNLPGDSLDQLPSRGSVLEYLFEADDKRAAGAYLTSTIELAGLCNEILEIFDSILEEAKPTLRFLAFLGAIFDAEDALQLSALNLTRLLTGCNVQFPRETPLLTINQLGVTVEISKDADDKAASEGSSYQEEEEKDLGMQEHVEDESKTDGNDKKDIFKYFHPYVFGTAMVAAPGKVPLAVEFTVKVAEGCVRFVMSPLPAKAWDDAFGFKNIDLVDVELTAAHPLKSGDQPTEDEKESNDQDPEDESSDELVRPDLMSVEDNNHLPFIQFKGTWRNSFQDLDIRGRITAKKSDCYLRGTMQNVKWANLCELFYDMHRNVIDEIDKEMKISSDKLEVELSCNGLRLSGDLSIYGKKCIEATIMIWLGGISVTAKAPNWTVDDEGLLTIEDSSITFSVGCKLKNGQKDSGVAVASAASKKSIGWYGGFAVSGKFKYKGKMTIDANLQVLRNSSGKWGYVATGKAEAETPLTLHDIINGIPSHTELNFDLKELNLIASNMDVKADELPFDTNGFPVKNGIYLCTYLKKIPLIDGPKTIKRTSNKDRAFLYLGLRTDVLKPSIAVYLPPSMSVNLGPRIKVGDFYMEVSIGFEGPEIAFIGNVTLRLEDGRDPLGFELAIRGDAISGQLSLVMDGIIENPFNLSKRITLGAKGDGRKLGIQVGVIWEQIVATGIPSGLGLSGTLILDNEKPTRKSYGMLINVSENPLDFILILEATELTFAELMMLTSALSGAPLVPVDAPNITFRGLSIYASMGGSFGSTTYPPGFRLKGIMLINGTETYFNCSISLSGLELTAYVPSFQMGPLTLTGTEERPEVADWPPAMTAFETSKASNGATEPEATEPLTAKNINYAKLQMTAKPLTQMFILKGHIAVFDVVTNADIHCEYKPTPTFRFNFMLRWNSALYLDLRANKINTKSLSKTSSGAAVLQPEDVRNADFDVSAIFSQTIVAQVREALEQTLKQIHDALDQGVGQAQRTVDDLNGRKQSALGAAELTLQFLEREFGDMEQAVKIRKADHEKSSKEEKERLSRELLAARTNESTTKTYAASLRAMQISKAEKTRDDEVTKLNAQLQHLVQNFHSASSDLAQAQDALNSFLVDAADWFLEKVSSEYRDAKRKYQNSQSLLDTTKAELNRQTPRLEDAIASTKRACENTCQALWREYNNTVTRVESVVAQAQTAYNLFERQVKDEVASFDNELQQLRHSTLAEQVKAARKAVVELKKDDSALAAARQALAAFDLGKRSAYAKAEAWLKEFGSHVDVQYMSLKGTLKAEQKAAEQKPFLITVQGTIAKTEPFSFELGWKPWREGLNENEWFERLGQEMQKYVEGDMVLKTVSGVVENL